jgi:osmotically-inducible protein OsmY
MFETQTARIRLDKTNRCRERSWLSIADEKRFAAEDPVNTSANKNERVEIEADDSITRFDGLIHIGQKVFLPEDQLIGLTTKLFLNLDGHLSHVAIRTAHLLGSHKMIPIASISDVNPSRVMLSINREQFNELPDYQADSTIAEEVDRALWKDVVLRDTDYYQIDVRVRNGIITLNGHVMTSMNQWRAETAVKNIPGILGFKSYLIPDDKLLLEVAEALGQIEQGTDARFFTKVENGLAVLVGEVSSLSIRDQAEQCVADIPWVRGIINEIHVPGIVLDAEEERFLQPLIGNEMLFKDSLPVTIHKVVINPHNRRVIAMIVSGRFPNLLKKDENTNFHGESNLERLVVLPVNLILSLTRSTGFISINSNEITEDQDYDPTCYTTPAKDWLPPYPYCTAEVLFLVQ